MRSLAFGKVMKPLPFDKKPQALVFESCRLSMLCQNATGKYYRTSKESTWHDRRSSPEGCEVEDTRVCSDKLP